MGTSALYLSHWEDKKDVYVTNDHLNDLQQHHLDCIRSLYESYNKKFKGKLVTYPEGINIVIIIRALLSAIINDLKCPVLIICDPKTICLWHYEMSKIKNVTVVNYKRNKINSNNMCIIITTLDILKEIPLEMDFSLIIGDEIESLFNKVAFKRIKDVPFKVAFSKMEFYCDDELKILWNILKWVNPNLFGKLNEFVELHKDYMNNLRDQYDTIWHRIEWDLSNDYESEVENTEYKALLDEWCDKNNFIPKSNKTTKRSLGNKSDKRSPQSKKTKSNINNLNASNSTINFVSLEKNNFIEKTINTNNIKENDNFVVKNGFFKLTNNSTCGTKRSIQHNITEKSIQFKKYKSTNTTEKNSKRNNFYKSKSTSDLDSVQTIFEKDSWVEDIMIDVDVSKISCDNNTVFNANETTRIHGCMEDIPFSLATELKLFNAFTEDFKVEDKIDQSNEVECFSEGLTLPITNEKEERIEEIYPILDAVIKGSPLENIVEKYKILQGTRSASKSQTSRERTPSPISTVTDKEMAEFPLLDAIINISPLKKAMEQYKINVLGTCDVGDDFFPFTYKTDLNLSANF